MSDYIICIDASVDIEQKFIEDHGVVIIPMEYMIGTEEMLMEKRLTD